ncbi:aminotransferase [Apiospora marii]|uniref:Aminotransferase n=1 Tax=Apiospora marii TaxID=335849 RepID=A0ABR1S023_9PEZI
MDPPINLVWGKPAPSLLPVEELAQTMQSILSRPDAATDALEYGDPVGPPALRDQLAQWLTGLYGTPNAMDEICITSGASQGLAVVLQVLSDPLYTQRVWVVTPCFHLGCKTFEDAGLAGKLRAVPETSAGIDLDHLERELQQFESESSVGPALGTPQPPPRTAKPVDPARRFYRHLIYLVPTFSNPSGRTVPLVQRQRLVALARRFDALVISDDIYDHLPYPPAVQVDNNTKADPATATAILPRFIDIERTMGGSSSSSEHSLGHTLSIGSFSKMIGPGVRTGWISASPGLTKALAGVGASQAGGCPSQLGAALVAEFMAQGHLARHVRHTLLSAYARRRGLMTAAVRELLGPLGARVAEDEDGGGRAGGFFVWLRLPAGLDGARVAARCAASAALAVLPGAAFEVPSDRRGELGPYLRLCFAWEAEGNIRPGVRRLAAVVRAMLLEGSGSGGTDGDFDWKAALMDSLKK